MAPLPLGIDSAIVAAVMVLAAIANVCYSAAYLQKSYCQFSAFGDLWRIKSVSMLTGTISEVVLSVAGNCRRNLSIYQMRHIPPIIPYGIDGTNIVS